MKKILLLFIFFFVFCFNVNALTIDTINIDVNIDSSGIATIKENWKVEENEKIFLEKEFYDVKDIKITDYQIVGATDKKFKEVKTWDVNKKNTLFFKDKDNRKSILFTTDNEKEYNISYKVDGIINKFKDVYGINWFFLVSNKKMNINHINIAIKGNISYNETNTAIYAIGNNLKAYFDNGKIHLSATKISDNAEIKLMTTFTNIEYKNAIEVNENFNDVYQSSLKGISLLDKMLDKVTGETIKTSIFVIVVILVVLIISKLVLIFKNRDEYYGIESLIKEELPKLNDIKYYDEIPCNKDIYEIAFIGGYYKIIRNRSNIVGALFLKWLLEGSIRVNDNKIKPSITIFDKKTFDSELEKELYNIVFSISNNRIVDSVKINNYAKDNSDIIINWFDKCFNTVIEKEIQNGNIKKQKKNLILGEACFEYAKNIIGLKRYLLNFNQVPRQHELTEERYKYSLICAEILGIGESLAKEILRKSPDNKMAKSLFELQSVKAIYKSIYSNSLMFCKQKKKNKIEK